MDNKRSLEDGGAAPAAKKPAVDVMSALFDLPVNAMFFGGGFGGVRSARAAKGGVTKAMNKLAAQDWAAAAATRPYQLADLRDPAKAGAAGAYFSGVLKRRPRPNSNATGTSIN